MTARGCGGARQMGAIYATALTGVYGHPIEEFLIDPPISLSRLGLGHLASVGVHPFEASDGKTMILDRIGLEHYPDVAGFVEEARRNLGQSMLGVSRRISRTFPFRKITRDTLLYLAHDRALILNCQQYIAAEQSSFRETLPGCSRIVGWQHCKRGPSLFEAYRHVREDSEQYMCSRLWWQDVTRWRMPPGKGPDERAGFGVVADTVYSALSRPARVADRHAPAVFMRVPFKLEVVRDTEGGLHEQAFDAASEAGVDVVLVDE